MAIEEEVYKQVLKHKGIWNFSELYTFCFNYLKDNNYIVSEDEYTEKASDFGKEIQIKWKAKKKVTDYFHYVIEVKWHILGLNSVEAEKDGKKIKSNKGDLKMTVSATLIRDPEGKWEGTSFWQMMRGVYDKFIIKATADDYEDALADKADGLIEDVKAFLVLEGKK